MLNNLSEVLAASAEAFGDKVAVIFQDQHTSFNELHAAAERCAAGLAAAGIKPGEVVTLWGPNSLNWLISYYGVLRLGAVINPVNLMLTPNELVYVVNDCKASAVIGTGVSISALYERQEEIGDVRLISFDSLDAEGVLQFADITGSDATVPAKPTARPDDLSTICYTSGTTGHPKGAMQSHQAVIFNAKMTAQMHGRGADDVVVSALPCPHVYGNVVFNSAIMFGATLVLHAQFDAGLILSDIERHKATIFDGVPTMYMFMLDHAQTSGTDVSSLKRCFVGGQTMPAATMQAVEDLLGVPLWELWGMTEIAGLGTTFPSNGPTCHGSIGCAIPYMQVQIQDLEGSGKFMPAGEPGELVVRGPCVMLGYFGNENQTTETIDADGWLHTGDVAKMDAFGRVFVVDRKKDMILTAGYNVYPAELERVLAEHPAVSMSAVGPVPDDKKGEIAKAYIVLKSGAQATEDEILDFCKDRLAAYKRPRFVQFVEDLPKTSSGKIMRRALADI